jgi:hypothetical protein
MSLGIAVVGGVHIYRSYATARESGNGERDDEGGRPKKRPRARPNGPWCVTDVIDCPPSQRLTNPNFRLQASSGHVYTAPESRVEAVGLV